VHLIVDCTGVLYFLVASYPGSSPAEKRGESLEELVTCTCDVLCVVLCVVLIIELS